MMRDLIEAIEERRLIRFRYLRDSGGGGERVCHPHVLFESSAGNVCLDAFQVDGVTSKGVLPAWRVFDTSLIANLHVASETFIPDADLNLANTKKYVRILAHC